MAMPMQVVNTHNPRVLYNEDAERKLLAAMIKDEEALLLAQSELHPEDLYEPLHQKAFKAILDSYQRNGAIEDIEPIHEILTRKYAVSLNDAKILFYRITESTFTASCAKQDIDIVLEHSMSRKFKRDLQVALSHIEDGMSFDENQSNLKAKLNKSEKTKNALSLSILSATDLLVTDFPARQPIIQDVIQEKSLNMIYAPRGTGKTFIALELALAIADGSDFLVFDTCQSKRVLYFDAEMPVADTKDRIKKIHRDRNLDNFFIQSGELLQQNYSEGLMLNSLKTQNQIENVLRVMETKGQKPEVLIFDNLSAMTSMDENSNTDQEPFLRWLIRLRHKGFAVILVHHTGKNGTQRGASRKEDPLDTVIKLTPPEKPKNEGAEFTLSFTKCRGNKPDPFELFCELVTDDNGSLSWLTDKPPAKSSTQKALDALCKIYTEGLNNTEELSEKLKVSKRTAQNHVKFLKDNSFMDENWNLTKKGEKAVIVE